ncbi:hypothetical protein A3H80_04415 [Candidatus Roizmanbacteria bacterium RIFCSPLOWO2_02_FULL_37_19]|uniref:NAD-dependent epimerase/dehydratase domain-containing protein n=1 Tax=Candidatus Roizmanbacteria bacterium RIFCSPHIGHO2_02_FULL_37_24 TaxID=1802037 RepID=A0A1F7GW89_9BACT|nr:MAG: hypothetical protein A3C24_01445 [Candidatus Roizmanbacteria bacterium RIFCSPHIGHO2_02_FULL_37_24]OGK32856.1 MAG: hypothetical protein A3E10_00105 [Candidatus Roizmanbacteria bacterium RIFCSPHIGHO2_12_FULL_37_23]OGK54269.1 MAG: hypothetical protein A3H80_04415 [Candidatus Roizmanbacteria bacterium RIFCSPLOWO2_02_FULL_37_19]OGK61114.1 MAG: hypothetical protein A3G65_01090 [Candidatus Roizmanbacteria bacterium RIFCSPLOWO2_12_FULL_37_7b]
MRLLITGHQGFIGTHLFKKIKQDHSDIELIGIDKKSGFDITDYEKLMTLQHIDLIVHLAATCSSAKSITDTKSDFTDNVIGSFNICECARKHKAGIVYVSSCKVQPNEKGSRAPYGLSKYVGELYIEEYSKDFGIEYVINRFGTVYGPGQDVSPESGWLTWFIQASKSGKKITINGDGKQSRDVLFIDNCVRLLEDQIVNFDLYKGEVYDVGGGPENEVTLLQVLGHLDYDNYDFGPERIGDVKHFVSDNKKITSVNGWKPKIGWKKGIEITKINN